MSQFQEAKAHFIASHQHPMNQVMHHLTNIIAITGVICLFSDWRLSAVCLVLTQALAWSGHWIFEKNEPAFIKYPSGIMILASMSWSFEHWFGFRQLFKKETNNQELPSNNQ